jgi:hypothetical protein
VLVFLDVSNIFQILSLILILLLYLSKTAAFGGRIEILQIVLLVTYVVTNFGARGKKIIFASLVILYFVLSLIEIVRANPLSLFDQGEFNFGNLFFNNNWRDLGYVSNTYSDVLQSSMRIIGLLQDHYIDFEFRISSFLSVLVSPIVPTSMMPEFYNLSTAYQNIAQSGGGGLISAFGYIWLGFFGPIIIGFAIGFVINSFYSNNSPVLNMYGLLLLVTFPRWFSYYPVPLIKLCLFGAIFIFAIKFFDKSFRCSGVICKRNCIDPVKSCSGVIFEGNTDEHTDGRRHQTLDGQAQSGAGHGDHSRQDHGSRGQPIL